MDLLEPIEERPGEGTPELSVLMPLYNSARIAGDAVASVLRQEGCIAEILISDDQSSDGTLAAAREALAGWRGPHRIRLFRSRRRLAHRRSHELAAVPAFAFRVECGRCAGGARETGDESRGGDEAKRSTHRSSP